MWTQRARAIAIVVIMLGFASAAHAVPYESQGILDDAIAQLPVPVIFAPKPL